MRPTIGKVARLVFILSVFIFALVSVGQAAGMMAQKMVAQKAGAKK